MNENDYIRQLLQESGIFKLLKLEGKYCEAFIERIIYEYRIFDKLNFTTSKYSRVKNFWIKALLIIGGAILSFFKSFKIQHSQPKKLSNLVALCFADKIVRFKVIQSISSSTIDIVYPPIFHYNSINKHISYFQNHNKTVVLGRFLPGSILYSLWVIVSKGRKLNRCSKKLDDYFESYTCKLPSILILSILYREYFVNFIKVSLKDNESRLWLLDYDFDLKYIIFNSLIHGYRPKDKTIHIQHGSFFEYEESYCNPISDISLCCSPREEEIIKRYNKFNSIIKPLGAPLQSFIDIDKSKKNKSVNIEYDFLILLTNVYDQSNTDIQISFLKSLNFNKYKYLVRFRPASQALDEITLKPYIGRTSISANSSLQEDIDKSKVIISFSYDAIYSAIRNNKKIILITKDNPERILNFESKSSNIKLFQFPDIIPEKILDEFLNSYNDCTYTNDNFILYNFGNFELGSIRNNFISILRSLSS